MIRAALALLLIVPSVDLVPPGEDLPTCDAAAGIVTDCVVPQGPWETEGREIGDGTDPAAPADPASGSPAYTG